MCAVVHYCVVWTYFPTWYLCCLWFFLEILNHRFGFTTEWSIFPFSIYIWSRSTCVDVYPLYISCVISSHSSVCFTFLGGFSGRSEGSVDQADQAGGCWDTLVMFHNGHQEMEGPCYNLCIGLWHVPDRNFTAFMHPKNLMAISWKVYISFRILNPVWSWCLQNQASFHGLYRLELVPRAIPAPDFLFRSYRWYPWPPDIYPLFPQITVFCVVIYLVSLRGPWSPFPKIQPLGDFPKPGVPGPDQLSLSLQKLRQNSVSHKLPLWNQGNSQAPDIRCVLHRDSGFSYNLNNTETILYNTSKHQFLVSSLFFFIAVIYTVHNVF